MLLNFAQIFDSLKIQNVNNFYFKERAAKNTNISFSSRAIIL